VGKPYLFVTGVRRKVDISLAFGFVFCSRLDAYWLGLCVQDDGAGVHESCTRIGSARVRELISIARHFRKGGQMYLATEEIVIPYIHSSCLGLFVSGQPTRSLVEY